MLDAKIASALNKIIQNSRFKKKVTLQEQKAQKEDRFLRGRQIAFMIYDYFRVTGAHDTVLDYADLFSVTVHDENIQEFDTRWDEVLLSMSKIPSDDILESLYKLRIRESAQLKTVLELYDMEIHQKISMPNCQNLKTPGTGKLDQEAVVKNRKGINRRMRKRYLLPAERKRPVRKESDVVSVTTPKIVHKNPEHTAATLFWANRITRVESVSRKRSIQGKSNHGAILRQPCRSYLKGTCTRSLCEYWHPPECQCCKNESGCKAGDKCLFPHHKVDEQPNKKPKKSYHSPKGRASDDKNAVAVVKTVAQLGCVSQDSELLDSQRGKQAQGDPMQKVLRPIRRIRFTQSTLCQASLREKKGPSLGKINVKAAHQRSPLAMKMWGPVP